MDQNEIDEAAGETLRIFRESGAIVEDVHVVHISGLHFPMTINKEAIFPHLDRIERLARLLTGRLADLSIDVVCWPQFYGRRCGKGSVQSLHQACTARFD